MINAIIMASGYGRRMGKNKLLLTYKDKPLVQHIIEKVVSCDFYNRTIIVKDEEILSLAMNYGLNVVRNHNPSIGQSEAVKLGIDNTTRAKGYMFFTADQPLLDVETIELLVDAFKKNSDYIIVPTYRGKKGSPVIFPLEALDELRELQGDIGGRNVINNNMNKVIFIEVKNEYVLMDVDTWEDYEKLISIKE